MANRHRGDVAVRLAGRDWTLRLTLGALAEIEAGLDATSLVDLGARFAQGLRARDLIVIFAAAARGGGAEVDDREVAGMVTAGDLPVLAEAIARLLVEGFGEGPPPDPRGRLR
ncbi:MAG: GTA-gp10 family protein [Labrys sp. (in: a-proteobacteria)]